jgi:3-deoxy-manno-octulosonate cytidylyltransferase (CMP-KDO synthetase)
VAYKKTKVVGIIPARMKSSRFHGKPLANILGKPMLKWVYEHAQESKYLDEVFVATDHLEIEAYCKSEQMPCIMTSDKHVTCTDRTNEAAQMLKYEFILEIQGDEPALFAEDMDKLIDAAFQSQCGAAILYTNLPSEFADDPNHVKLVVDANSRALYFSRSAIPNYAKKADVEKK